MIPTVPDQEKCEVCKKDTQIFARIRVQDFEGNLFHVCSFMCAKKLRNKIRDEKENQDNPKGKANIG